MGTSMSLSQKQRQKLALRNHSMPRNKISVSMEKYYRYKNSLMKPNSKRNSSLNPKNKSKKPESSMEINLPNQIPSIELHSDLLSPQTKNSRFYEEVHKMDEECVVDLKKSQSDQIKRGSSSGQSSNYYLGTNTYRNSQPQNLSSDAQANPASDSPASQIKQKSKNKIVRVNRSSKNSSNKKSSYPQSESNHALSEIIFHREGQITTNITNIERYMTESEEKGGWVADTYRTCMLNYVEEGQNQEDEQSVSTKQAKQKQTEIKIEQDGLKKSSPIILEINSNIINMKGNSEAAKQGAQTAITVPTNVSQFSLNAQSNSLASSNKPRKLIYF